MYQSYIVGSAIFEWGDRSHCISLSGVDKIDRNKKTQLQICIIDNLILPILSSAQHNIHKKVLFGMRKQCPALRGFSRIIISRDLWKSIFVPAVTYRNAVLVFGSDFEEKLEVVQRGVMRYALGCRFVCANEFVEGEMGYSTFIEREFKSKIKYAWRLMEQNGKWANELQRVKQAQKIKTKWDRRVEFSMRRVGIRGIEWNDESIVREEKSLNSRIRGMRNDQWKREMEHKSSLGLYRNNKQEMVGSEFLYDNREGSKLLADARAGMLNTRVHRGHYKNIREECGLCGEEREDIEHVVMKCKFLGERGNGIEEALGFGEEISWESVGETKSRLTRWQRETRKIEDIEGGQ
jgi:hypothetical protein